MKELDVIVPHERLNDVNSILHKNNVGGMYFAQITGRGRARNEEVDVVVGPDNYKTGKRYVPEFGGRTMITIVVPDEMEKPIVEDILSKISTGQASDGKIFVKSISSAYDIGTRKIGEEAAL